VVVRCTKRMLDLLGGREVVLGELSPTDDDWYLNLLWIDRQKCLLLTHAGTSCSVFRAGVRSADLRPLGDYLVAAVETELRVERLPADTFGELQPDTVRLAKTASRSTLGFMNEMAFELRYVVADTGVWGAKIRFARAKAVICRRDANFWHPTGTAQRGTRQLRATNARDRRPALDTAGRATKSR
jgi:hypothetical protein